mgnify:CR=1 FL=1
MAASSRTINLIGSAAPLLSGRSLSDCETSEDATCQGGVAAVAAYIRHHSTKDEPSLVVPLLDTQSQFVNSHPMGWNVNQLIFQEHFRWKVFTAPPFLLYEGIDDNINNNNARSSARDLSGLQTPDMPLLLTNVAVPPSNSWKPYLESVHFDPDTGIALIRLVEEKEEEKVISRRPDDEDDGTVISSSSSPVWSQLSSALNALDYIAAENKRRQCTAPFGSSSPPSNSLASYNGNSTQVFRTNEENSENAAETSGNNNKKNNNNNNNNNNSNNSNNSNNNKSNKEQQTENRCWVPIIFANAVTRAKLDKLIAGVSDHPAPPALIVDLDGAHQAYSSPQVIRRGIWVLSQPLNQEQYYLHTKLTLDTDTNRITDLVLRTQDLSTPILPDIWKNDTQYAKDVEYIHNRAIEAVAFDPVVGNSNTMPAAHSGVCAIQECEIGNLIADALQWKAKTDVAFVAASNLKGPGWSFGQVHTSDIWGAIPTPTTTCIGTIRGASLLKLLDGAFNTTAAGEDDTAARAKLLQVAGVKVVYNKKLETTSKLVSVQVWYKEERVFQDINPLRLYTFATESDICTSNSWYGPSLEREDLLMENDLLQNVVGEYLGQLTSTYVPVKEGRLQENPEATVSMDLKSTNDICPAGKYWNAPKEACFECPSSKSYVAMSDESVTFRIKRDDKVAPTGRLIITNRDLYDFVLVSKEIPEWFHFTSASSIVRRSALQWPRVPVLLESGQRIAMDYRINATELPVGAWLGNVTISVSDYSTIGGCFATRDSVLSLETRVEVTPSDTVVQLDTHAAFGLAVMGLVLFASMALALHIFRIRERWGYGRLGDTSIKSIQPLYLATICLGVSVMALAIVPLSIDDPTMSGMCLLAPWLISLGLTIVFSALLSKLSTAKKILDSPSLREIQVSTKDLVMPFIVLFSVNFAILFCMLIDPPGWGYEVAQGEDWKFYGACQYSELSSALTFASGLLHLSTLFFTCFYAYQVAYLNDEFHELKNIGLAVFIWLQIVIICIPFWFILDDSVVVGRYYFKVGAIGALCLSMLLCIFFPVLRGAAADDDNVRRKTKTDLEEDNQSSFGGGFLGFSSLAGSLGGNRRAVPVFEDEDNEPAEQQNRCLADRLCY